MSLALLSRDSMLLLLLQVLLVLRVCGVHMRMRVAGLRRVLLGMEHVWVTASLSMSLRLSMGLRVCLRVFLLDSLRLLLRCHHRLMLRCGTGSWHAGRILALLTGCSYDSTSVGLTGTGWSHDFLVRRRHDGRVHGVW